MSSKYFLIATIILISFFSCRKKEMIVEEKKSVMLIGVDNPSVTTMSFPTPVSISVEYDSLNLYGTGSYSFDFDLDGENEITLELKLINNDSIHLLNGGSPNYYPSLSLKSNDKVSILTEEEVVYVGLGATTTLVWLKANSNGDEIKNSSDWKILNEQGVKMWYEMPLALSHKGTWHNVEGSKYIAFRYEDKMGWVEVDATDFNNPLIISYSIQR